MPKIFSREEIDKAKCYGISLSTMYSRYHRGWNREKLLTTPPIQRTGLEEYRKNPSALQSPIVATKCVGLNQEILDLSENMRKCYKMSWSEFLKEAIINYVLTGDN